MSDRFLVSVMIPAFNAEDTILDTLNCVHAQTYRPIELVIIDDGSTDATGAIIEQWVAEHESDELRCVVQTQENRGLLATRWEGVQLSSGSLLQFLDNDDLLHPQKLSICVERMLASDWDVAETRVVKFRENGDLQEYLSGDPVMVPWTERELKNANITIPFWHSVGPVIRREIVERAGPPQADLNPFTEEMEFHARIKCLTKDVGYLDEALSFRRIGRAATMTWGKTAAMCKGRIDGAIAVYDILLRYDVQARREWYWLFRFSLLTYYRSVTQGCDREIVEEACRVAKSHAKTCGSLSAVLLRYAPHVVLVAVFKLLEVVRRVYRREPIIQPRQTLS